MSDFQEVLSRADSQGRFLNSSELEPLRTYVAGKSNVIDAVGKISANSSSIVSVAARALFSEQPQLIAPGGNAHTAHKMAACLRDMEIILRYITYAMLAGDAAVLNDRCLNGLRETYLALGTPTASVAVSIQKMKNFTLSMFSQEELPKKLIDELASYFDLAALSVS